MFGKRQLAQDLREILQENPDILCDAILIHPTIFVEAIKKANSAFP